MKYKNKFLIVTCDGGAATGKSTGAKMIARKYNLAFLSSGLLYRYSSYLLLKYKPKKNIIFLKNKFQKLKNKKLSKYNLHSPTISAHSAEIAKILKVRKILKKYQIDFARKNKCCVIEGRDASTKVLPDSDVKFFFKCNLSIAAKRRYAELKKIRYNVKLANVKKALKLRNISDIKRKHSPLKKHQNAVVVDTGKLNKQAMLKKMVKFVEKSIKLKYGK